MTVVLNLYGGPGTGKSTTAAAVFALLKQDGFNVELVREFAKDIVWEGRFNLLMGGYQLYVFAEQWKRMRDLEGKVDAIITDSPLPLSLLYGETSSIFKDLVLDEFHKFTNINFFLERAKVYNPSGRMQTEDEARAIDEKCKELLNEYNILYSTAVAQRGVDVELARAMTSLMR